MSHRVRPIALGIALAVSASTASAQTFSGVDVGGGIGGPRVNSNAAHAAWAAAAAPLCAPTETFEGFAVGAATPLGLACGMTLTSNGPVGAGFSLNQVANDQNNQIGYNTTAGGANFFRFSPVFGAPATARFALAPSTTAFGLYVTGVQQHFGVTTVTWGGNAFVLPDTQDPAGGPVAGVQFFGFVSNVPVAFVDFTTVPDAAVGRDILGFDDVQVSVTPEPGSVALLTGGLLALGAVATRRRRA